MKTAFVTGGTGFLGRNLLDVLIEEGWQITCLHRASSNIAPLQALDVALVVADIADARALEAVIPKNVDAVFHVAANTSMWRKKDAEQTRDNVDATRAMVEASLAQKAKRFIVTSSIAAYAVHDGDLDESTPQRGGSSSVNYERTKYAAERLVKEAVPRGLDAVVMNPGHIVGRYDTHNWSQMVTIVNEDKLPGIPPGHGPFGSAREIARAHVRAVERGKTGENYLLGGVQASFAELIGAIGQVLGKPVRAREMPAFAIKALGAVQGFFGSFSDKEPDLTPETAIAVTSKIRIVSKKAEEQLGFRAVPLRELVEECVEWMRGEGMLAKKT